MILSLLACNPECAGPGCEFAYPAAQLAILAPPERDTRLSDIPIDVVGSRSDLAGWTAVANGQQVFIGMPESGQVVRLRDRALTDERIVRTAEDFGTAMVLADTDGDGQNELWVGAPGAEDDAGAVYRFTGVDDASPLRRSSNTPADRLGQTLVVCSGADADRVFASVPGYRTAPDGTPIPTLGGAVVEVSGTWPPTLALWGAEASQGVGTAMACGRLDGQAVLVVGAPWQGPEDAGIVHVLPLSTLTSGPLETTTGLIPPTELEGGFGQSLALSPLGLVVGSPRTPDGTGAVGLFPTLETPPVVLTAPDPQSDHFGQTVAAADDTIWVGAPAWRALDPDRTRHGAGALWTFDAPLEAGPVTLLEGDRAFAQLGASIVPTDLDGDGGIELLLPLRAPDPTGR